MIDDQAELDSLLDRLADEPSVGIDCEMDSMYAYRTSLCVVQVGWPGGEALIDGLAPLDRGGLARLFADPAVTKIFHSGENDIGLMADRWNMSFVNIFDTMAASQVLGHQGLGLAALLERHFGVHVSKKYQKADWRVRPLPDEQAEYARIDVRYLIPLRDLLLTDLQRLERVEEAGSEFERIARTRIEDRPFDPESWSRVKECRDLPPELRGAVRALHAARDRIARELDRAPYRVFHDSTIIELVRRRPADPAAYRRVRGANRQLSEGHVRLLLESLRRGLDEGEVPMPRSARRRRPWEAGSGDDVRLTDEQEALLEALRAWRVRRAELRQVELPRVATTALLVAIARAAPRTADELAQVPGMQDWRLREYGEDIVRVVRGEGPA